MDPLTVTDIVNFNTISKEMAAYFWYAVENRVSILVAGGIAAGKTTLLNVLSMFIKPDLKVVSIEDTRELNLPHENWIPAATRASFGVSTGVADISLFDLLKASLRQRPDYIIVGEIRGVRDTTNISLLDHLGCLVRNRPQGVCYQIWFCLSRIVLGKGRLIRGHQEQGRSRKAKGKR